MPKRALAFVLCILFVSVGFGAEREWQKGTWRDYKVDRPKVSFSAQPRDPTRNLPSTNVPREIRTFVIETSTQRLELRQDATIDTPRIDAVIGDSVMIAIDKKTVYVKDTEGKEHKLSLRRQTKLTESQN